MYLSTHLLLLFFLVNSQVIKSVMWHHICLHDFYFFWNLSVLAIFLITEDENVFIHGLFIHI